MAGAQENLDAAALPVSVPQGGFSQVESMCMSCCSRAVPFKQGCSMVVL